MMAMEKAVREFHARAKEIERVMDAMDSVLGMSPESDFYTAAFGLIGGYMAAIEEAYSMGGWLDWWLHECRLGDRPMQAGFDGELRTVATVDDLLLIIEEEIRRSNVELRTEALHDCRNCANRGRVNGLSQETYCDSCIFFGAYRESHFLPKGPNA